MMTNIKKHEHQLHKSSSSNGKILQMKSPIQSKFKNREISKARSCNEMKPNEVEEDKTSLSPVPRTVVHQSYLNDGLKFCKFIDKNPNVVMSSILRDLLLILKPLKSKNSGMFHEAYKSKHFSMIEREIASLRAKNFLFDDNNEQWLKTSEEKLCFFINLHNFLVLFGLCKRKIKTPPETQLEWTNFLKSITVNVSNLVFSAFEIHHSILRSLMPDPVMPNPSLDNVVSYPKYTEIDKKSTLAYDRKDALINFGIYLATKSSPALRVYNIKKISAQMKANAVNYLMKTIKIESNKAVLTLPEMLD